eukprot:UN17154
MLKLKYLPVQCLVYIIIILYRTGLTNMENIDR